MHYKKVSTFVFSFILFNAYIKGMEAEPEQSNQIKSVRARNILERLKEAEDTFSLLEALEQKCGIHPSDQADVESRVATLENYVQQKKNPSSSSGEEEKVEGQ